MIGSFLYHLYYYKEKIDMLQEILGKQYIKYIPILFLQCHDEKFYGKIEKNQITA